MDQNDVWIDKFVPLEIYTFPYRTSNLLFLLFFTAWFSWIIATIQFMGLAFAVVNMGMAYTGLSFFVGYMFIITEYTALGHQRIPAISGTIFTSEKPRLFKLVFLILTLLSLFLQFDNIATQFAFLCFCMFFFPIATSILVWDNSLVSVLNPAKWLRVLSSIATDKNSIRYLGLQGLALSLGYVTLSGDTGYWLPLSVFLLLAVWTTMFRLLGVVMHTNAETLGVTVRFGEGIEKQQRENASRQEINAFSTKLYSLNKTGQSEEALELLQQKLKESNYQDEYEYFVRFSKWEDLNFTLVASQKFIARLVSKHEFRRAFEILEFCFAANQNKYVVRPANIVFALAEQTETRYQRVVVVHLLEHFEEDFGGHPKTSEALLLAAEIAAHELDDWPRARQSLAKLKAVNPRITTVKRYRTLMKLLSK